MTAVKQFEPISVEDYLADERILHNRIVGSFVAATYVRLRGKPCQAYNSDTKVRVRMPMHTRFYYPDGMVVCESNPDDDEFQDRPVVIAEVLSPSTRRIDE